MKKTNKSESVYLYSAKTFLPTFLTEDNISQLSAFLAPEAVSVSAEKGPSGWGFLWVSYQEPASKFLSQKLDEAAASLEITLPKPEWKIEQIPDIDWLAHSYQQFPAFSIGPFYIYGSHHDGVVPDDQIGLLIDAATAFGSGEHGTTKGCMVAMLDLKEQGVCPWNILDMGTGSGILGIAAWKLWKTPVLAIDNDAEAVRVADHHRDVNDVPVNDTGVICGVGEGFSAASVQKKKPFDLIIANILAGPLKDMAGDLKAVSDENGFVILSGILNSQADEVLDVYKKQKLVLKKHYEFGEWSTLVLQNAAP